MGAHCRLNARPNRTVTRKAHTAFLYSGIGKGSTYTTFLAIQFSQRGQFYNGRILFHRALQGGTFVSIVPSPPLFLLTIFLGL
jgi:hypothetical protein